MNRDPRVFLAIAAAVLMVVAMIAGHISSGRATTYGEIDRSILRWRLVIWPLAGLAIFLATTAHGRVGR